MTERRHESGLSFDVNKMYRQLDEIGNDWADKKAAYQMLDDMSKTVLAQQIKESTAGSVAACKTEAERSIPYLEHLQVKADARKAWLLAEVKWQNVNTLVRMRQTEAGIVKAEMNIR